MTVVPPAVAIPAAMVAVPSGVTVVPVADRLVPVAAPPPTVILALGERVPVMEESVPELTEPPDEVLTDMALVQLTKTPPAVATPLLTVTLAF